MNVRVKNKKHLQGICNNLVESLANHPSNYLSFWSHFYLPDMELDLTFSLLTDNEFPEFLNGKQCKDINQVLVEYRGFFLSHLEKYNIKIEDIDEAFIHIVVPKRPDKSIEFDIDLVVKTSDEKTYKANVVRTYWEEVSK